MKKALLALGFFAALATYAPAQEMSVISGKLLGYDGKPMLKAHLNLYPSDYTFPPLQTIEVAKNGGFEIKFKNTGLLYLNFSGVNHYEYRLALLVEKPLQETLTVRLKHYEYIGDFSQIKIIGDFNNFEIQSAQPMTRQEEGTFVFEMDTTASTLAYQILGAEKRYGFHRPINSTQADDIVYDDRRGYVSVVKTNNGKVKIVFDPMLRGKPDDKAVVQFKNPNSFQAQFYALADEDAQRTDNWRVAKGAYMEAHQNRLGFTYDWSADLAGLQKRIAQEKNLSWRQVLLMQYLSLGRMGAREALDKNLIEQAFAEIPATSPLWGMKKYLIWEAVDWSSEKDKYGGYLKF
jgi:hypothetical protein